MAHRRTADEKIACGTVAYPIFAIHFAYQAASWKHTHTGYLHNPSSLGVPYFPYARVKGAVSFRVPYFSQNCTAAFPIAAVQLFSFIGKHCHAKA